MNRSTRVFAATLAATSLSILLILPSAAASTSDWVNTATQALSLNNATDLGPVAASTPMQISVALKLQNQTALQNYIRGISTKGSAIYGQSLTPSQFATQYSPTSSQVQSVTNYLTTNGLTNVHVSPNNLFITASGSAAQIESAFHTQLEQFQQNGKTVYANIASVQVPGTLGNTIGAVLGLNNALSMSSPLKKHSTSSGLTGLLNYPASYTPQGFQQAYDVGSTPAGKDTSIAIFAEGDLTQVVNDLRTEETANSLPQVPVSIVSTGMASPDTSGVDEWDMDTQYSTGMAQTVNHLYLYDATSLTDSDIALEFNKFVTDDIAKAGSASFGEGEYSAYLDGSMLADDEVFMEAAAQGQTVFASSGDTGGFSAVLPTNGVPIGAPDVNYPASSPYVVAVGGTTLITNSDGSYNEETAWLAGGGGPSEWEAAPSWQSGIVPLSAVGKGLPDISLDADPNSGAQVYVNGQMQVYGGTSLSSPLALGAWSRLESSHANQFGFASPLLYAQYGSSGFHDIILGDNGPYPATPGWDYATGMGTFDVSQMNNLIGK